MRRAELLVQMAYLPRRPRGCDGWVWAWVFFLVPGIVATWNGGDDDPDE